MGQKEQSEEITLNMDERKEILSDIEYHTKRLKLFMHRLANVEKLLRSQGVTLEEKSDES